jgi:acetyltransferase-like isoleucine patch superfamily enzyme
VVLPPREKIKLGHSVFIGPKTFLDSKGSIEIGDGSILSTEVVVLSSSHNILDSETLPYSIKSDYSKTSIGRGCWIGYRVILLPGIELGDGVIVGAGSVVTKSFETGSVIAGNPAKLIRKREVSPYAIAQEKYLLHVHGALRR